MKKQQQFLRNISYTLDIIIILIAYLVAKKFSYNIDLQYFSYPFFFLSIVLWFTMSIFSKIYFEKRSNKFAEEMVQMIYHSILFIVSLSSVLFFLNLPPQTLKKTLFRLRKTASMVIFLPEGSFPSLLVLDILQYTVCSVHLNY